MVEWKKLGDVCEIRGRIGFRGYTRDDQVQEGLGAISLSPGNIENDILHYNSCTYISWSKYEESPEIMVNNGDIVLCKTASIGKVAIVKDLPTKSTINPQLVLLKNINTKSHYLYFVLSSFQIQKQLKVLAGIGSVPNISQAKLAQILIPIPSIEEQERIVGILDTFTTAIENLKKQIEERRKQYEFYRDQLLDLEGKEGVVWKRLEEVCDCNRGVRVIKNELSEIGIYPVFQNSLKSMGYYKESNYEANTTFVITAGAAGDIGFSRIPFWAADDCLCVKGNKDILDYFVFFFLESKKHYLKSQVRKGAIPRLSRKVVENLEIPIPSLEEQQRIVDILDTFEASIQNLEAQLEQRQKQYEYYRNKLLTFE